MNLQVLDTDILTHYQRGHPVVCLHCADAIAAKAELALSIISVEEQFIGWHTQARQAKRPVQMTEAYRFMTEFVEFIKQLTVIPFSQADYSRFLKLKSMKLNVSKNDLRIAATTLEHNAVLITRNLADFRRVPGLVAEDWTV